MKQTAGAERRAPEEKTRRISGSGQGQRLIPFEEIRTPASHPAGKRRKKCPDCRYCQGCSQDRCRLCRTGRKPARVKLSQAEQIALFEKINHPRRRKPSDLGRQ
ncbi:MAG TPA: hypothetical protein VLR91_06990 [Thermodesulfobacteriota bacterium]|nr:hypothetical protein [Thermodesulfobacteriota bacterium]